MADTKISALTQATLPALTDEFAVNQGGGSKKVTLASLQAVIGLESFRLALAGTARLILESATDYLLLDLGLHGPTLLGTPKVLASKYAVPDGYEYEVGYRLTIAGLGRLTALGNCDVFIEDDFAKRSRIVLAGVG